MVSTGSATDQIAMSPASAHDMPDQQSAPVAQFGAGPAPDNRIRGVIDAQPDQKRRDRRLGSTGRAVFDLQRDPQPRLWQNAHEHTLGPGLDHRSARTRGGQFGAAFADAVDQDRMGRHGVHDPPGRVFTNTAKPVRRRHPRGGAGQTGKRAGEIRRRTAVDAETGRGCAGHALERLQDRPLHWMIGIHIIGSGPKMCPKRKKPGVFAGTVVVHLTRDGSRRPQPVAFLAIIGRLWPAPQIALAQTQAVQPHPHARHVRRRAHVACAGKRQMRVVQPMRVKGTAFDQGQRLDHLARTARVDQGCGIAPGRDDVPTVVDDHRMPAMARFDTIAPRRHGKDDGISHLETPGPCRRPGPAAGS